MRIFGFVLARMKRQPRLQAHLLSSALIAALVGSVILASALAGGERSGGSDYKINKAYSSVGFSVYKWRVLKEEGTFRDFEGRIHYDPKRPDLSQIEVTVQAASLDTGNGTRDSVLRSDDFFHVEKYPTLHFVSDKITQKNANDIEVVGALTIHGVTKRITIPARVNGTSTVPGVGTLAGFEATFTIDRTDYGVNGFRWSGGSLSINKDVSIHLALGCVQR